MNTKYLVVVATMAVMLIGATAFATDSAFADGKKKYEKNQALSQANACGNGELPLNVLCSNSASQIQGDENAVSTASFQEGG
ncbi:MAG: hypothetical protein ACRD5J_09995 [Nitrososphaeraceae archaeon]|jgi:hypothetical protein